MSNSEVLPASLSSESKTKELPDVHLEPFVGIGCEGQ